MTTELTMTPFRATALLRRFKHDEKMLGPNEQAAIDFAISAITALTQRPAAQEVDDAVIDKAWVRFAIAMGDTPGAPYPGMARAFEAHFGQSWLDKDWRNEQSVWAAAWRKAWDARALPAPQQATPTTSGNILTDAFNEVQALKQQATPEPLIVKGAMAGMVDAQVRDLWPTKGATPEPVGSRQKVSSSPLIQRAGTPSTRPGKKPSTTRRKV